MKSIGNIHNIYTKDKSKIFNSEIIHLYIIYPKRFVTLMRF